MRLSSNFLWFIFLLGWIVSLGLMLGITFYWQPRIDQAYERGKIDGQLLVFEKWGHYGDDVIEQLVDCIYLRTIYRFDSLIEQKEVKEK